MVWWSGWLFWSKRRVVSCVPWQASSCLIAGLSFVPFALTTRFEVLMVCGIVGGLGAGLSGGVQMALAADVIP